MAWKSEGRVNLAIYGLLSHEQRMAIGLVVAAGTCPSCKRKLTFKVEQGL